MSMLGHRGRDLDTAEEISEFVERFYRVLAQDELFHHYFAGIDWQAHLLTLTDFWRTALLDDGTYDLDHDTVIERHRPMHAERAFDGGLFERWLETFYDTLDGGWSGPQATRARRRGHGIAWAMAKRLVGADIGTM